MNGAKSGQTTTAVVACLAFYTSWHRSYRVNRASQSIPTASLLLCGRVVDVAAEPAATAAATVGSSSTKRLAAEPITRRKHALAARACDVVTSGAALRSTVLAVVIV